MDKVTPTIKGIFVKSHINAVYAKMGDAGLRKLEGLYGKTLQFKNSDNVPIREEVEIIEAALEVLQPDFTGEKKFEAEILHFKNFTTTPLARIIFSLFRRNFKLMMMQAQNIAGHVFKRDWLFF